MTDTISYITIIIIALSLCCGLLITVAAITVPILLISKKRKQAEELVARGSQGEATILSLTDTGMRVNDDPRVTLELEINMPMYPPYQVSKTLVVPLIRLAQIQVGAVVPVMVDMSDPTNPDKVGLLLR
ncbi:MAG: hypothetical protein JXB85_10780 [Anaerolineales bacterium]|nr:hypothetical protein [Anaerolineales bacterium]